MIYHVLAIGIGYEYMWRCYCTLSHLYIEIEVVKTLSMNNLIKICVLQDDSLVEFDEMIN